MSTLQAKSQYLFLYVRLALAKLTAERGLGVAPRHYDALPDCLPDLFALALESATATCQRGGDEAAPDTLRSLLQVSVCVLEEVLCESR